MNKAFCFLIFGVDGVAIIQTETRKRGFVGRLVKWAFILFNLFMVFVAYRLLGSPLSELDAASSAGDAVGATLRGSVAGMLIVLVWVGGCFVLGLLAYFTRGKKITTTENVDFLDLG